MEAAASTPMGVADSVEAAASAPLDEARSEEQRIVLSGTTTEDEVLEFILSRAARNDKKSRVIVRVVGRACASKTQSALGIFHWINPG